MKDSKLYLPSDLSQSDHYKYCPGGLFDIEDHLRFAEASDTHKILCYHLQTHSFTNRFKIANITGQIHNTHAWETQGHIDDNVQAAKLQYWCFRDVLLKLRGLSPWEDTLQVLEQSDVVALNEWVMTAQEKKDIHKLWEQASVVVKAELAQESRWPNDVGR